MVEKVIPAGFLRDKIEDQIRDDQGPTGDMQEDVFLKAWQPCQRKDLEFTGPVDRRGQQWLRGKVHDFVEPFRGKKRDVREDVASLSRIRVVQYHRFDQPGRFAAGTNLLHITRRERGRRMQDESAGGNANDRHRSTKKRAQEGERVNFDPKVVGKLFHQE
jgi:hypothetical protein